MSNINRIVEVSISPEQAFQKFINEINNWWPKEYTWSQDELQEIRIEPKKDGLCTEIGPYGFRCDWGRVTELIHGKKINLKWQISPKREPIPDPDQASDITMVFDKNGESTTIKFEHRNFENHGEGAEDYQKAMDSEWGWDYILGRYQEYCARN
jgi:hypothetical protein